MDRTEDRATERAAQEPVRLAPEAAARLDALFREYNDFVVRYAVSRVGDDDLAQDIAQNAWLRIIPNLRRGEAIKDPRSFLAVLVKRSVCDYRRPARNNELPADWTDAMASFSLPVSPPADEDVVALAALPVAQARVIKLAAQGLSQREIAARLGQWRSATGKTLHRAARNLRVLALAG